MKHLFFLVTALFILLLAKEAQSTHIVGGEMYYEYHGANEYKITLIVYRDCFNGIPPFDNPAYISVFDTSWNRIQSYTVVPPIPDTIPLENYDSCTWVDTVCYEVAKYEITVILPSIPGGYNLAYDRCCWNHSVINIYDPDHNGLIIRSAIPDRALIDSNSSPIFVNRTPTFFCVGKLFEFDHTAIDLDGDSLSYELFTPFNSSRETNSHLAPLPGPYSPLIYYSGYSLSNVLGSAVPLTIDAVTGKLKARLDNKIGQFVFGVRVNEYRNGILIGYTERSYQINSQNCTRYTKAKFDQPITQCGDSVVFFNNESDSAKGYLWHFDDPDAPDTISIIDTPNHVFSRFGNYKVTLVAYSYQGNSCNDTASGMINLYPNLIGDFNWLDDKCTNFVQFEDITNDPPGKVIKWFWDFGDGTGATVKSPYKDFDLADLPKSYPITLIVENDLGCRDTIEQIYTGVKRSYQIDFVKASKYDVYPRSDSTLLTAFAEDAILYTWTPIEGLSSPNSSTTYASPKQQTTYKVRVTDGRGCYDERNIEIDVYKYNCGEEVVYVPNAFSPNGDGENDYLRVRGEEIRWLKISIFNRWGQLIYESTDHHMTEQASLGWDGSFNGVKQDPGVYVYQLDVECNDKHTFTKKGNITLIR